MSTTTRTRALTAALLIGLIGFGAACAAPVSAPYYGIYFTAPTTGYPGQSAVLKATATSKLPVVLTLDATSTGCSLSGSTTGSTVSFDSLGTCVINANEPGDATHAASKQVQRKINIVPCPTARSGIYTTTVLGKTFSGLVTVNPDNTFSGSVNLTALGVPGVTIINFNGIINCQIATGTINGTTLSGVIAADGSTLSASYMGIAIVLKAPPVAP